jgi:hypothetical protein
VLIKLKFTNEKLLQKTARIKFNSTYLIHDSEGFILDKTELEIKLTDIIPISSESKEQIKKFSKAVKFIIDTFSVITYGAIIFSNNFYLIANSVDLVDLIYTYRYFNVRLP